jgi:hypothetical protein
MSSPVARPAFPGAAAPGAVGVTGYSPLIQLPDGAIQNAPQLANRTGQADKAITIDTTHRTVRYRLTDGFSRGNAVSTSPPRRPTPAQLRSKTSPRPLR